MFEGIKRLFVSVLYLPEVRRKLGDHHRPERMQTAGAITDDVVRVDLLRMYTRYQARKTLR